MCLVSFTLFYFINNKTNTTPLTHKPLNLQLKQLCGDLQFENHCLRGYSQDRAGTGGQRAAHFPFYQLFQMSFQIVALVCIPTAVCYQSACCFSSSPHLVLSLIGFRFCQSDMYETVSYCWFNFLASELEVPASAGRQDGTPFQIFIDYSFSLFLHISRLYLCLFSSWIIFCRTDLHELLIYF